MSRFKPKRNQFYFLFLLASISSSCFSADIHKYVGGDVSISMSTLGNNHPHIIYYNDLLDDAYSFNRNNKTPVLGLQMGYIFLDKIPTLSIGLGFYSTLNKYNFTGNLVETALNDPSILLYSNKFNIATTRLMLEGQLSWRVGYLTPYLNIGLGPAWVHMTNYSEAPADSVGFVALPPFQNRTNNNFAFQMGLGVGYEFNLAHSPEKVQHERISLGYRYVSLGEVSFATRGDVYPHKLNLGKLSNNEIYLSYTHIF